MLHICICIYIYIYMCVCVCVCIYSLIQIMACRLFGPKPLSEPMLAFYQLDPWEQSLVTFDLNSIIFSQEEHLKMSSAKYHPLCIGLNVF